MTTVQPSATVPTKYWHQLKDGRIQCDLCPRYCTLQEGQHGLCFVRARQQNRMVLTTYGRSSGFCVDPIEKKPLHHFLPGTPVLSFGTAGCNLSCKFCQNWDMSKSREMDTLADEASPETIASAAARLGCRSVAYTYNDPIIFHEYGEITSALIGRGLVLSAVFGPMAFFPGSTGVIYRQFSVTIVAAMLLSVVVALILTPVLCASLLKPVPQGHKTAEAGFRLFRPFFRRFDRIFNTARDKYQSTVARMLARKLPYLCIYLVLVVAMVFLFRRMPTAYLPNEDQGVMYAQVTLRSGSTLGQTAEIMDQVRNHFLVDEKNAVGSCFTFAGRSFAGSGIPLKERIITDCVNESGYPSGILEYKF